VSRGMKWLSNVWVYTCTCMCVYVLKFFPNSIILHVPIGYQYAKRHAHTHTKTEETVQAHIQREKERERALDLIQVSLEETIGHVVTTYMYMASLSRTRPCLYHR
jgi:hypothetical protein